MEGNIGIVVVLLLHSFLHLSYSEPVGTCPAENEELVTFLTDSENCQLFYKCEWGEPALKGCPDNLYFNPELNVCDWPENTACGGGGGTGGEDPPPPVDPPVGPPPGGPVGECPEVDGEYATILPDASNCAVFYKCEFGNPVLKTCPGGLEFNPTLSVCDWPESAGCSSGGSPGDPGEVTDEPTPGGPDDLPSGGGPVGQCPVVDGGSATLLPDATNCALFYKCEFGNPVLFSCPEGLEFNPTISVCDWPENAGCSSGGSPGDSGEVTAEPAPEDSDEDTPSGGGPVGECPAVDGADITLLPDATNCALFYKCEFGNPVLFTCPDGLEFNPTLSVCDWPENAGCSPGGGPSGSGEVTDEPTPGGPDDLPGGGGPVGECPAVDGTHATLLPDATNCALFYKCEFGNPVLFACPDGLEFNPILSVCDWPENAGCSSGGSPGGSGEVTDEPTPGGPDDLPGGGGPVGECPAVDGTYATLLPDATNCALFYKCEFGNPVLFTCPDGLEFNPTLSVCDWPENAGCSSGGSPGDSGEVTAEPAPEDSDEDTPSGGGPVGECPAVDGADATLLPDATNCALFYKCEFGNPVLFTCPDGLEFNPILSVCDWPENAGCSSGGSPGGSGEVTDEPTPGGPDDLPGGGGPVGECPAVDGTYATLLPDATNCALFYKCEFGNPVLFTCPDGLEFNPTLSVCDWPENAGCSSGGSPGDSGEVTAEPAPEDSDEDTPSGGGPVGECPAVDGADVTLLPDATNCALFYKCEFGNPVLFTCPDGLEFNPTLSVCDWPENAGCSSGGSPGGSGEVTDEPTPEGPDDLPGGGGPVGECPAVDGTYATLLPDATNCALFYKCEFGSPVLFTCPDGLEFNPTLSVCDWPENAGCSSGGSPGGSGEVTDEPTPGGPDDLPGGGGPVGECPAVDGTYATLLPDATNCALFYKCEFGSPVLFTCPDGLEFNPTLSVCDWPENAGCSSGGNPGGSGEVTPEPAPEDPDDLPGGACEAIVCDPENGEYVTFIPNDTDCTRFCKCDWGTAFEFHCPGELHFNAVLNVCDWPENAGCAA